jgi:hypothetical protein
MDHITDNKESGEFNSYWASVKPFISKRNQKRRLQWCRERLNWTLDQWNKVLWTDESPFVLCYKGKIRVWRMHNERFATNCTGASVKRHDEKIMVWGSFAAHGVGVLHMVEGIMTKEVYLNVLNDAMIPSADMLFDRENWIFQQDNDPKHTAKVVKAYFEEENVPLMDWPTQSPDLNPIENLWSILDARLKDRRVNNKQELFTLLEEEWRRLPRDLLERLVASMPRRCQAVIDAKGYGTKY